MVSRLGGEHDPAHDLGEGGGIAGQDAGRGVKCAPAAEPGGKALRLAQRDHLRRALALRDNVATDTVDERLEDERERQAKRVLESARESPGLTSARERRVRLAEKPEVVRGKVERHDALIAGDPAHKSMVLGRVVELDRPLAVREGRRELPLVVLGACEVRIPEERQVPVGTRLGRGQHLGGQHSPALGLSAIE